MVRALFSSNSPTTLLLLLTFVLLHCFVTVLIAKKDAADNGNDNDDNDNGNDDINKQRQQQNQLQQQQTMANEQQQQQKRSRADEGQGNEERQKRNREEERTEGGRKVRSTDEQQQQTGDALNTAPPDVVVPQLSSEADGQTKISENFLRSLSAQQVADKRARLHRGGNLRRPIDFDEAVRMTVPYQTKLF